MGHRYAAERLQVNTDKDRLKRLERPVLERSTHTLQELTQPTGLVS